MRKKITDGKWKLIRTIDVDVICNDCGSKYGTIDSEHVATFYPGKCSVCGKDTTVTEGRDYKIYHPLQELMRIKE
jgi:Zn finger protein HypA/HybF involved in hydrogenase expression